MLSVLVPRVLIPIAFVTFGAWWFVRHIQGRFMTSSKSSLESPQSVADGAEELSTEEEADHFESRSSDNDRNNALTESGSSVKRRRWIMAVIAIVVAVVVIRFAVAEAVPIVRELAQYSAGSYERVWAKPLEAERPRVVRKRSA